MSPGVNFHQEDERGGRIAYCPPLNPRAPPKDMEKMMGILRNFAAPRRRRDHVDRNRNPFRQRSRPNRGHFVIGPYFHVIQPIRTLRNPQKDQIRYYCQLKHVLLVREYPNMLKSRRLCPSGKSRPANGRNTSRCSPQ